MSMFPMARSLFPELRQAFRVLEQAPFAARIAPEALDGSWSSALASSALNNRIAMDVHETEKEYQVEAELPGVAKKDISLSFGEDGQTLTLNGKVERFRHSPLPAESKPLPSNDTLASSDSAATETNASATSSPTSNVVAASDGNATAVSSSHQPLWQERSFGQFSRTFRFPSPIESDKATASLKDGVLNVIVPKANTTQRHIQID